MLFATFSKTIFATSLGVEMLSVLVGVSVGIIGVGVGVTGRIGVAIRLEIAPHPINPGTSNKESNKMPALKNTFFRFILVFFLGFAAQRFALAAGGRDEIKLREQEKPEARKMPVSRAESHQSAARFVGTLLTCKTHLLLL